MTVLERGTTNGTVTDLDGAFTLSTSSSAPVLEVAYTGYATQEVAVGGRSTVDITLAPSVTALSDVVVIGYGTQRKADVTGSVSQIDGEALTVAPPPNLTAGLAGKITGVIAIQTNGQPGFDDAAFQIRGRSTLGNNNPLILVDGVERSFARINPFEIESVTALKDAASTAVYGSRAANGVLLVTTRRGRVGKPRFNASANISSQSPADRPELMDASEYVLAFRQALRNEGTPEADLPFGDLLPQAQAGSLPSYDWWNETLTNAAPQQQYNVSVDGGSEALRYFFAYGRLNQEGFFDNARFQQNSIRANVDADVARGLTFSLNLAGRIEDRLRSADDDAEIFSNVLRANPLNPVFVDGLPGTEGLPARSLGFDGFSGNSYGDANLNGTQARDLTTFQTNMQLDYAVPFVEGLGLRGMFAYDRGFSDQTTFFTPYTTYQLNEGTGVYDIGSPSDNVSSLRQDRDNTSLQTLQLSARYERDLGNHYVSGLALFERIEGEVRGLFGFRDGLLSPAVQQFVAGSPTNDENGGFAAQEARFGYVGRVNYGFRNRYLFQANLRVDESYIFPPDSRTGVFPAFSAGWRISEEPFMDGLSDVVEILKLRGSWGITGNDRIAPFGFLSGFAFAGGYVEDGTFRPGIQPTSIPNPNITWETATTTDIGLEASFLEGRFGFEVDYYRKRTEDILARRSLSVPGTFGAPLPTENIGVVDSWGWEFTARHRNRLGPVDLRVDGNLTLAQNEIIFIDEPSNVNPAVRLTGNEIGARFGFLSDGIYQNAEEIAAGPAQFGTLAPGDIRYRDLNGRDADGNLTGAPDGKITPDDRVLIGESNTPNLIYGFNLNLGLKGLVLDLNFQGATQYSRFIAPRGFLLGVGNNFDVLNDSWTADNPDARYPRILPDGNANNNQFSDFFLEDIHFLRLRNAQLGYDLGKIPGLMDRLGVTRLQVSLSATNALTFTNVSIGDPEGTDGNSLFYPIARVISGGINVGF